MQDTLWDNNKTSLATDNHTSSTNTPVFQNAQNCQTFGHDWQETELPGIKQCSACGITGYCPGCTANPPHNALPFSCTVHTQLESKQVRE